MERFRLYALAYAISVPVFVASLFWPFLQTPYMLIYFGVGLLYIFSQQQPYEDLEHSSVTHFQRSSRWNAYNYIIAAALVIAGLVVSFIPIGPHITTFVIWTLSVGGLLSLTRRLVGTVVTDLVSDYIITQMPDLDSTKVRLAVAKIASNPEISAEQLAKMTELDQESSESIKHYFSTYSKNNLEQIQSA